MYQPIWLHSSKRDKWPKVLKISDVLDVKLTSRFSFKTNATELRTSVTSVLNTSAYSNATWVPKINFAEAVLFFI